MRIAVSNPLISIASRVRGWRARASNRLNLIGQPHDFYVTDYSWESHAGPFGSQHNDGVVHIGFSDGATADLSMTSGVLEGSQTMRYSISKGGVLRTNIAYQAGREQPVVMWSIMEDADVVPYLDTIRHTAWGYCMSSPHEAGSGRPSLNKAALRKYVGESGRVSEFLEEGKAVRVQTPDQVFVL